MRGDGRQMTDERRTTTGGRQQERGRSNEVGRVCRGECVLAFSIDAIVGDNPPTVPPSQRVLSGRRPAGRAG